MSDDSFTAEMREKLEAFFGQHDDEILRQLNESLNDPFLKTLEAVERDHPGIWDFSKKEK